MRTEQSTECFVPPQALRARLNMFKLPHHPPKFITDRSKAIGMLWFSVACLFVSELLWRFTLRLLIHCSKDLKKHHVHIFIYRSDKHPKINSHLKARRNDSEYVHFFCISWKCLEVTDYQKVVTGKVLPKTKGHFCKTYVFFQRQVILRNKAKHVFHASLNLTLPTFSDTNFGLTFTVRLGQSQISVNLWTFRKTL